MSDKGKNMHWRFVRSPGKKSLTAQVLKQPLGVSNYGENVEFNHSLYFPNYRTFLL